MNRILAASLVIFAPSLLPAQESHDTARVAPVIVTATRTPLRADRVPASTSVVTGAELRAQGVVHLSDALRALPGVTVAQSGSYGAPASLFVRGGQSNYTKVLIDGVPANEPGGAFDFGTLTVDDVERIEIVRGPSSVVWGSDAVSAVVHIITRRGARTGGSVTARGGTFGTLDVTGSGEAVRGARRSAITAAHHESDGIYDFNSEYRSSLLGGSLGWAGGASTAQLGGRYSRLRANFPTDYTGAAVDPNAHRLEERTTASAEITRVLPVATVRLLGGHTLVNGASVDPRNEPSAPSTAYATRSRRQQLELRADVPVGAHVVATAGGTAEWQRRAAISTSVSEGTDAPGGPGSASRSESGGARTNRGAFVELLTTGDVTTVTVGGRYDHSETFGEFLTYRVGVSHLLATATRVRASLGTAFREPSFDESLPGPFSTGNPDIEPERTASWEVGAEQRLLGERLVLGATWFSQRFADMIDYFAESFPGRYENVAAARARGLELELSVRPSARLAADAGMTFLRTRVETAGHGGSLAEGRSLLRRPERSATAGVTWTAPRATLGSRVSYVGPRQDVRFLYDAPFSREETLPGYTKVDLSAVAPVSFRSPRGLAVTLRVENLLDAAYEQAAGYTAPGRVALVGLRATF